MGYPFLFFGRRPEEWQASVEMPYRLQFVEPVSADARLRIAKAMAEVLARNRDLLTRGIAQWRWSGQWAFMTFLEPRSHEFDAFFGAVDAAFRSIDRAAALEAAVFEGNPQGGDHPWDAWTLKQRRNAPPVPDGVRPGEEDPAFTAAFEAEVSAAFEAQTMADARDEAPMVDLSWRKIPSEPWPPAAPQQAPEAAVTSLLAKGKAIERYITRAGVTVGLYRGGVRYLGPNGKVKSKATRSHGNQAWMSPDGKRLYINNGLEMLRLALPEGTAVDLPCPLHLRQLQFLEVAAGQLLCHSFGHLYLFSETDAGFNQSAELALESFDPIVVCDGRLVILKGGAGLPSDLIAIGPGSLRLLSKVPLWITEARSVMGPEGTPRTLLLRDPDCTYEVTNLAEVLSATERIKPLQLL